MAADEEDNEVDIDGRWASARRATARQAIMATTMAMVIGDGRRRRWRRRDGQ